jgi:hypothetical protein
VVQLKDIDSCQDRRANEGRSAPGPAHPRGPHDEGIQTTWPILEDWEDDEWSMGSVCRDDVAELGKRGGNLN